jgi:hypothetical protein
VDRTRSQTVILAAAVTALAIFVVFIAFGLVAGSGR